MGATHLRGIVGPRDSVDAIVEPGFAVSEEVVPRTMVELLFQGLIVSV